MLYKQIVGRVVLLNVFTKRHISCKIDIVKTTENTKLAAINNFEIVSVWSLVFGEFEWEKSRKLIFLNK